MMRISWGGIVNNITNGLLTNTSFKTKNAHLVFRNDQHDVIVWLAIAVENPSAGFKYLMLDGRFNNAFSASKPFQ